MRWAERWSENFSAAEPEEMLRWASVHFNQRAAVVTSFQAEGMVILDLLHKLDLPHRIITIDTGRLPEETYQQIERVRQHYDVQVEVVMPEPVDIIALVSEHGPDFFKQSSDLRLRCCFARKVQPFGRVVEDLDCWIAGLRSGQGGGRSEAGRIELDLVNRPSGALFKVNPLLGWSEKRVWQYIHDNKVPYHPLYDHGYRSIGCAPCTRPSLPGEQARDSRWWWESGPRECGLHQRLEPVALEALTAGPLAGRPKELNSDFNLSFHIAGDLT